MTEKIPTAHPDVFLFRPQLFSDARGGFIETYRKDHFAELGIHDEFVQENQSISIKHTLRGLHFQIHHPQAKLCRVVRGEVIDVAVDLRRGSAHFGKHVSVNLSGENRLQLYVPKGFAHGFLVVSDHAEFLYKCSDFYFPAGERGVRWDDPDLALPWGDAGSFLLSPKDAALPLLQDLRPEDLPQVSG